jgi:alpha-L-fucosidase
VYDIERGKLDDIREHYWQTDTSVSYKSWCYIQDDAFKTTKTLVHDLVDIVSKNGNLLLNIGPKPDGTIPVEATDRLLGIGQWLVVNGEAIYGTRPWHTFGEGPTEVVTERFREQDYQPFTGQDVRFTSKGNVLYAICLGWPGEQLTITSFGSNLSVVPVRISSVSMLGSDETLSWSHEADGLRISTPSVRPCDHAYAFKIVLG